MNESGWKQNNLSATGRMEHPIRASKLIGREVTSSSGERVGQIEDILLNPASGRIDFAVIAMSGSYAGANNTGANTTASEQRLVPVPWSLLKPRQTGQAAGEEQRTLTLNVEPSKLNDAPSISGNDWSSLRESGWRERVYSHYGLTAGEASGGAESPSGTTKGAGASELQNSPESNPPRHNNP